MQRSYAYRGILSLGILLMLGAPVFNFLNTLSLDDIAVDSGKVIAQKFALMEEKINSPRTFNNTGPDFTGVYDAEKIGLYLFRNDSLLQWNNSRIPVKEKSSFFKGTSGLVKLQHGHYLFLKKDLDSNHNVALALCLIKPLYELENNYLANDFEEWTLIPPGVSLTNAGSGSANVMLGNKDLFGISGQEKAYYRKDADQACYLIFLTGFILVLVSVLGAIQAGIGFSTTMFVLSAIVLFRFSMIFFDWPSFFYRNLLYDVRLFGNAQSFANGFLGDILLNAILILFLAASIYFYFLKNGYRRSWEKNAELFLHFILMVVIVNSFNHTIKSLVSNSTLNFNFLSVFNIKFPAFIGLASICIYSLSLFISVYRLVNYYNKRFSVDFAKFAAIALLVCLLQWALDFKKITLFESGWFMIFALALFLVIRFRPGSISLALGIQILIMSVVTSSFLNFYIDKNQKQELEILSLKLSERQDPVLESEFSSLPEKISGDPYLNNLLKLLPSSVDAIELLLKQKFFSGYFDRYNLEFSLFDENCNPMLPVKQSLYTNEGYFTDQLKLHADSTMVEGLFFMEGYQKNTRYIARIKLQDKNLYMVMEAKQFEELGSFPDLLLDRSQQKHERIRTFSHAVYRSGQLTSHYGELSYPNFLQDSSSLAASNPGFNNYYFNDEANTVIVISERAKTWNYFFTFNSYLLLFFSLLTYTAYLAYAAFFTSQFQNPSLTRRIQTIIILLLLFAMSAIGFTSGSLVTAQFEADNKKLLDEKTQVIIDELSSQFSQQQFFEQSRKELINLKLKEYARLFNTPISLFDREGFLYNTSETKLYDLGLAATVANPKAYSNLKNNLSSAESVTEKAGTLTYLSFYTPLYNANRQLMGFVNLPYFAKQSALENELSGIISALINVYVILFVISILAGLILSGYITQPLRLIKQQIANITLEKQNEKINWQSNDEIGKLVSEYNQMLLKLENSASLLAQSERESAWREMAKQVAHEIKNPLTPMKLNLQYLQHLMKNDPSDFKEKFEKTSLGIIEQIDALANIATEFSNFAKLPGAELRAINLNEVINSSVLLFENQDNIKIKNNLAGREIMVKGDRDQCLRVFNNILMNAVQALEGSALPQILIDGEVKDRLIIVSVKDNGPGIADELKPRLFTPNFTTKSTGSGLGLAMVSNIMKGLGGRIWFESDKDTGTVFYLEFKLADQA